MDFFTCKRTELFDIIKRNSGGGREVQKTEVRNYVLEKVQSSQEVKNAVSKFCSSVFLRLDKKCARDYSEFSIRFSEWLEQEVSFGIKTELVSPTKGRKGRPPVNFENSAPRTKRVKSQNLRQENSAETLLFSAAMQYRKEGFESTAKLLHYIYENPELAGDIFKAHMDSVTQAPVPELTPEKGLSVLLKADLSKAQYNYIREECGLKTVLPSYDRVLEEKKKTYPPEVLSTEVSAEVKVQTLLNHDAARLVELLERDGSPFSADFTYVLELDTKWGVDGSGSHAQYQQNFQASSNPDQDDRSILLTAAVPLRLKFKDPQDPLNQSPDGVLWHNTVPNSTRFCKPLKIRLVKESKEIILEEEEYIRRQIEALVPTELASKTGAKIIIFHSLHMTMIDGKTRCFLTGTNNFGTCCICKAKPSEMKLDHQNHLPVDQSTFKFGLSVLHARIRTLEFVLHVSYKLEIKKFRANESLYIARKKRIQDDLRDQLGILVDCVKPGVGSTNNGNLARKFFKHPEEVSEITGFSLELLERFETILCALNCGSPIDSDKYREYALDTVRIYESLYPWYHMSPAVHMILIHGADIISHLDGMPMGAYSEEALESSNKYIRAFRERRTRKTSRQATMEDLMRRLLLTGDIVLSSLHKLKERHHNLPDSVLPLLAA